MVQTVISAKDLCAARSYIDRVAWKAARTMPTIPHCYTVVTWMPGMEEGFRHLAKMIVAHGTDELFGTRTFRYLYIDDWKYWIMSAPMACVLINRAKAGPVAGGLGPSDEGKEPCG